MADIQKKPDDTAVYKNDAYGEPFYKFTIDSLPVAVVTVNADFRITGLNP